MKTHVLFRKIHYWGSICVAVPLSVMIVAGIILMFKKDFDWIQPPSQRVEISGAPDVSIAQLFESAKTVEEADIRDWNDLSRADIKPDKGIIKFVSNTDWEVQVSLIDGSIKQVAYRRSDWLETIHDGSYFSDGVKYYLFLPAGFILFFLWMTGLYLFIKTEIAKAKKRNKNR